MIHDLVWWCTDTLNSHSAVKSTLSCLYNRDYSTLTASESTRRSSSHSFCHSKLQCEPPSVPTAQRLPDTWTCPEKRQHSCAAHKQSSHPAKHCPMLSGKHTSYHAETTRSSLLYLTSAWSLTNSQQQRSQSLEEYCAECRFCMQPTETF